MKKLIALIALVTISFILMVIYVDVRAIKNSVIEIHDVKVNEITSTHLTLRVYMVIINEESREIKDLEGEFEIFILNTSIGKMYFNKVNVPPHSSKDMNLSLLLYYDKVGKSIIDVIMQLNFKLCVKGEVRGRILFGMLKYKKPVEIVYV